MYPALVTDPSSFALVLALLSGLVGALLAQLLSNWHARKLEDERKAFEIRRTKLDVLRKIAGNRAAVTSVPLLDHRSRFFEGLNEVMVVFSDSSQVSTALLNYKAAIGTSNHNDRLIDLFKAVCRDVGIDPTAFNDSLFLEPFIPKGF